MLSFVTMMILNVTFCVNACHQSTIILIYRIDQKWHHFWPTLYISGARTFSAAEGH